MGDQLAFSSPVTRYLDSLSVAYKVYVHPGLVSSVEQAAYERSQKPSQVVRSIVFRISEGDYVLVLIAGVQQISWPTLRKYLGVNRLTLASKEEVETITGYSIGAVSPFGTKHPIRVLADEEIFSNHEISIGSGQRGVAIILNRDVFHQALINPEIGRFAQR